MTRMTPARTLRVFFAITVSFTLLALPGIATAQRGQEPAEGEQQPAPTVIRTYNISDLMRSASDYPLDSEIVPPTGYGAGGLFSGGGGGSGNLMGGALIEKGRQPVDRDLLDPLSGLIIELVDPNNWTENGGNVGQIKTFGPLLVIVQTEDNHARIQALLDEIRRNAGPSQIVSVHATWVLVQGGEAPAPASAVDAKWLAEQNIYCDARTVCFSGQTVHLSSGRGRTVVTDITPIVGTNAVAFDPTVAQLHSGVAVQVSPQLVPGAEAAVLDVQSFASEWDDPLPPAELKGVVATQPSGGAFTAASLDRMNMLAQEMKTTLRVPLATKYVVGGMTLDPAAGEQSPRKLCLIVEINAVK